MVEKHFHDIFFNGKSLADFGVHVSGGGTFNSPEKDYETVEIPGRNGNLHIFNERFKNVDLTYKAFIAGDGYISGGKRNDFANLMRSFRAWMLHSNGYQKLEDTYHLDEYRKALFKGPIETEAILLQAGEFDLTFNCMPQRFLKSGDEIFTFTKSASLDNPTLFDAKSLVRVYGHGTLAINDRIIQIATNYPYSYLDIDCEIQDAYYGTTNCNKYITLVDGEFFKLEPGENTINLGSGITRIDVTPRWWTI